MMMIIAFAKQIACAVAAERRAPAATLARR
jgi:hypothetical protein